MSDTPLLRSSLPRPSGRRRIAATIESTIGAFFMFVVGFVVVVLGGYIVWLSTGSRDFRWMCPTYAVLALAESAFLFTLKNGLEHGHYPFAPWFAARQFRWPIILRPILALWWLAHFATGVSLCILMQKAITSINHIWIFLLLDITIAYSSNLYALLALSALGFGAGPNGKHRLHAIWRWRLLFDITVGLLAAYGPGLIRH